MIPLIPTFHELYSFPRISNFQITWKFSGFGKLTQMDNNEVWIQKWNL